MGYPVTGTVYASGGGSGGASEQGMGGTGANDVAMNYIPTLYAGKLLVKFYEVSVLSEIANTDYEGMISDQGDSVIIRTLPTIEVNDHVKGMVLSDQVPNSESIILPIDQGKYWSFRTDDPDLVQTDVNSFINDWTEEASYELRNKIEIDVLEGVESSAGHIGDAQGLKSASVYLGKAGTPVLFKDIGNCSTTDAMIDCALVLDEDNIPDTGRFFLMPPRMIANIKQSSLVQDASKMGDATSVIRNGMVGMFDRFMIYKTNNLLYTAADKAWSCLFGTKHAITFASQLVKTKSIDNPTGFGMLHRGLQVYGFKVVKPEALGRLYATSIVTGGVTQRTNTAGANYA